MCGGQLRHGDQPEQEELADQQSEPLPGDTLGQAPQPHAIHGKGGTVIGRAVDPDLHGSAFIFPLGSGSR